METMVVGAPGVGPFFVIVRPIGCAPTALTPLVLPIGNTALAHNTHWRCPVMSELTSSDTWPYRTGSQQIFMAS
jgi:hypothetical protein